MAWLWTDCRYSPVGVFFLIVQEIVKMVDPYETFSEVAFYTLTVAVGLVLHGYGILPLIYWVFVSVFICCVLCLTSSADGLLVLSVFLSEFGL